MLKFAILAALLQLAPGYNNVGQAGEVAAINAATSNATATVTVKSVESLTLYTNATQHVVTYEPAWRVTVTNHNPSSGWRLEATAFPVVYTAISDGAEYTVTGNESLTYLDDTPETMIMQDNNTGTNLAVFEFDGTTATCQGADASSVSSLSFGGNAPVPFESPRLEYASDPASYVTNVVGYLNYDDFKWTNGVSTIVGEPVRFDMAITNTVIVGQVAAQTFAKTNTLATVTTSGHFGTVSTNAFLFGGAILIDGAEPTDKINILIK